VEQGRGAGLRLLALRSPGRRPCLPAQPRRARWRRRATHPGPHPPAARAPGNTSIVDRRRIRLPDLEGEAGRPAGGSQPRAARARGRRRVGRLVREASHGASPGPDPRLGLAPAGSLRGRPPVHGRVRRHQRDGNARRDGHRGRPGCPPRAALHLAGGGGGAAGHGIGGALLARDPGTHRPRLPRLRRGRRGSPPGAAGLRAGGAGLRSLRGPGSPRRRLHGQHLPRLRPGGRARGRDQDPETRAAGEPRRGGLRAALPQRGAGGREARAPEHRHDLRRGRRLFSDGAAGGRDPAGAAPRAGTARPGDGLPDPGARGRRPRLRPQPWHDPPGREAREHHDLRGRLPEGDGLRRGPPGDRVDHRGGRGLRLAVLHGPRADHPERGFAPDGHLLPRGRRLRGPHRTQALRGRGRHAHPPSGGAHGPAPRLELGLRPATPLRLGPATGASPARGRSSTRCSPAAGTTPRRGG
jgi:hypothetical protein